MNMYHVGEYSVDTKCPADTGVFSNDGRQNVGR